MLYKALPKIYPKCGKGNYLAIVNKIDNKNNMTIILSDSSKSGKLKTGEKKQLNL